MTALKALGDTIVYFPLHISVNTLAKESATSPYGQQAHRKAHANGQLLHIKTFTKHIHTRAWMHSQQPANLCPLWVRQVELLLVPPRDKQQCELW